MSSKKVSAHDVFTVFENGGGWPTTTVSVFVGLLGSVFATYGMLHSFLVHDHDPTADFKRTGTDCAVHVRPSLVCLIAWMA